MDGYTADQLDRAATVETMIELALLTGDTCSLCPATADGLVMHACGAPGGLACATCWAAHRDYMRSVETIAGTRPYCRHCDQDVASDHVYLIGL